MTLYQVTFDVCREDSRRRNASNAKQAVELVKKEATDDIETMYRYATLKNFKATPIRKSGW